MLWDAAEFHRSCDGSNNSIGSLPWLRDGPSSKFLHTGIDRMGSIEHRKCGATTSLIGSVEKPTTSRRGDSVPPLDLIESISVMTLLIVPTSS